MCPYPQSDVSSVGVKTVTRDENTGNTKFEYGDAL